VDYLFPGRISVKYNMAAASRQNPFIGQQQPFAREPPDILYPQLQISRRRPCGLSLFSGIGLPNFEIKQTDGIIYSRKRWNSPFQKGRYRVLPVAEKTQNHKGATL